MSLSRFLQLISLGLVVSVDTCDGAVPPCYSNWFGSPCRYKCHCASGGTCNKTTGECTEPTTCEKGWFGPSCQYVDLVTTNTSSTPVWVYDSPDSLCNPGQETVTISLTDEFYFTWLRLRTDETAKADGFKLKLMTLNGSSVECSKLYISMVSDTTVDIHCQAGVFFQQLTLTGDGVKYLCSVQISGGRNIAQGQKTTQTSINFGRDSWLAVDGDISPDWDHESCTLTSWGDNAPSWTLAFDWPHHINRYVLHNRDIVQERLQGFILEADQENTSVAFNFTDLSRNSHNIYRIQSTTPQILVSNVTIVATYKTSYGKFLTLCEVEMFGDTACPVGQYGRECENQCNCAKDGESCFVSTGGCPSGCAAGYQWEECQFPCRKTYLGVDCSRRCSTNCKNQDCQPNNGLCLSCVPGTQGALCDKDCNAKFWGDNCSKPCSTTCKNQLCNTFKGTCISCVAGKSGENCDQACSATYYGENCALSCSPDCANQICSATNGICQSCVPGKSGLYCDKGCPSTTFGKDCNETCSTNCTIQLCEAVTGRCASCIRGLVGDYCDQMLSEISPDDTPPPIAVIVGSVVGFVVLVTLIVSGVLIFRRCRHNNDVPAQTTPSTSQNNTEGVSAKTVQSDAETAMSRTNVIRQTRGKETWKLSNMPGNRKIHQHDGRGYNNDASTVNETPARFGALFNRTSQNRGNVYQEQLRRSPSNSNIAEAPASSSDHQNSDRHTPHNDMNSSASNETVQQSNYENWPIPASNTDATSANPYEIIRDSAVNTYDEINYP